MNERQAADLAIGLMTLFAVQNETSGMVPGALDPTDENFALCGFALQGEVFELIQELGWKPWKTNPELTLEQLATIAEEFADVLAFLGQLLNLVYARTNLSPADLALAYRAKTEKNQARFRGESGEKGYDGFGNHDPNVGYIPKVGP